MPELQLHVSYQSGTLEWEGLKTSHDDILDAYKRAHNSVDCHRSVLLRGRRTLRSLQLNRDMFVTAAAGSTQSAPSRCTEFRSLQKNSRPFRDEGRGLHKSS